MTTQEAVECVVKVMVRNRHKFSKVWEKVRLDRVEKLVPTANASEVMTALKADERVKMVKKEADEGLVDAVQLRYDVFTKIK